MITNTRVFRLNEVWMCRTACGGNQPRTILKLVPGYVRATGVCGPDWLTNAEWNDLAVSKIGIMKTFLGIPYRTVLDPPHRLRIVNISDGDDFEVMLDDELVGTCGTYGKAKKLVHLLSNSAN